MFHCGGTAIVYDVTGHDEYIVHGRNALVARANDEFTVKRFITQLQEFPAFMKSLKAGALETAAQWPDWRKSGRLFQDAIQGMLEQPTVGRSALRSYANRIQSLAVSAVQQEERRNGPLGDRLRAVERQLSDVYRSSSWRITRPLRIFKRILTEKGYIGRGMKFVIKKMRRPLFQ
jgi:hypothetical protein